MTDHPRDEFDKIPESSARQGVHRERLIPAGSSGLGLKITVGILALLIGLGAYFILPRLGLAGATEGASATSITASDPAPTATATAAATSSPTASASESAPSAAAPSASSTPSPAVTPDVSVSTEPTEQVGAAATPSAIDEQAGVPDRTQAVSVLNGTGAPGLASSVAGRLAAAGWNSAFPGNWAGTPVDASVVLYSGEAQRASAEAVAADLGITSLVDSPSVASGILVVLGPGFQ
ncbi:LytR family transcriptional regulator [Arthrobacter sp. NamB2]|uniref:LytR C-terminal domain-containing protein n=1 Tax=Arthrobacter sp. NamB2 TaxID=2576035 RepID=UPI0010C953E6|nr:LytR C-terminal domain-containing protein [Arthrobacter sp. NamB2]TKV28694.1 LytR family transcriptional regulator [Arthrobacter sp. NamB2]